MEPSHVFITEHKLNNREQEKEKKVNQHTSEKKAAAYI
jgi:hypothetical protein